MVTKRERPTSSQRSRGIGNEEELDGIAMSICLYSADSCYLTGGSLSGWPRSRFESMMVGISTDDRQHKTKLGICLS